VPHVPAEERRKQFIAAARKVIVEHGVEGATTRRIAEAAGAPLASLHYSFHTKEDLLYAIFEHQAASMQARSKEHTPREGGLGVLAADLLRFAVDWMVDNEDDAIAGMEMTLWARRQDPTLAARAYQLHLDSIVGYFDKRRTRHDDPALVEPLARAVIATIDGLTLQWMVFHDRERIAHDVEVIARGIELRAAPAKPAVRVPRTARRTP
jgi:AcrR family transcriptional regulator